ncbi:MAG: hypothetical protein ACOC93_00175 [Planctomycetota bacterium]
MCSALDATLLVASLLLAAVPAAGQEQSPPFTGRMTLLLDEALYQTGEGRDPTDGKTFQLDTGYENGEWLSVIGVAPDFNRGHHRGRVVDWSRDGETLELTVEMRIAGDPWVPGGPATYEVSLDRVGPARFEGSYSGTFRDMDASGKATATLARERQPREGFVEFEPGTHPRILLRKSEIPRLQKRAEQSDVVQAAYERFKGSDDIVALGMMYQLTGDESYAERAKPKVMARMKERGSGSHQTGHIWGERLADVALAYDLMTDAWDEEFNEYAVGYIQWVTERLIMRPNSVSPKVNWSPNSNYHAWLRGGAAIGGLALTTDEGPEPVAPRDPGTEPTELAAPEGFEPGEGVPIVDFRFGDTITDWLFAGPLPDPHNSGADYVEHLGGRANAHRRIARGAEIRHRGQQAEFQPLGDDSLWEHNDRQNVELTKLYSRNYDSKQQGYYHTGYFFAVVQNDKPRLVQFKDGAAASEKVRVWISGRRVYNGDYLTLGEGLHPILVHANIGETSDWGKIWIAPHFARAERAKALEDLAYRQRMYQLAHAEWQEDHRAWEEAGGANPHWIYLADLGEYHMAQYYRYCMGEGGWQTEGESYTPYSSVLPLLYATAYRNMHGMPVTSTADVEQFVPRYIYQALYGEDGKELYRSTGPNGTIDQSHYARAFPIVPDDWKPGVLWAWNQALGLEPDGRGTPTFESARDAVYTWLHYPTEMQAQNPGEVMPRTFQAPTKGGYIFRNGWKGADESIVTEVFGKSEGEGGWARPNGGTFYVFGLGRHWSTAGLDNDRSGSRWLENVVILPEDENNEGMRARKTYLKTWPDGSGVVSFDMDLIYAGRKTRRTADGEVEGLPLRDNNFRLIEENFEDLGIRGMRSVAADYSGRSGADALIVVVDKISGGNKKIWQWQLPALDKGDREVSVDGHTFTLRQGEAVLRGAFIAPTEVNIQADTEGVIEDKRDYGEPGTYRRNAIRATGADGEAGEFFVVLTLDADGDTPTLNVDGQGLDAEVTVGDQRVSFDGEKIDLGR